LHDLGHAAQFDSGNAGSLAQALGKAESQLALLQARNEHDIFGVLTDEQRKELADHEACTSRVRATMTARRRTKAQADGLV
jgi:Spy/CpxP family protein refolding chaperone